MLTVLVMGVDLKEKSASLLSTTTVDLDGDAATEIYVVPEGKRCVLQMGVLVLAADAATTDVQIGQNGATDDFVAVTDLGLINAAYDCCILQPIPAANVLLGKSYAAGTSLEIEVTNQAGAAGNTLYLFGFLY